VFQKALKLYHEQIKKKEPKVEASKPSPSPSTSDVEPPDTKQHLFYKNVKHLESLAKFGYEKSSTSSTHPKNIETNIHSEMN
jgi:hypothetical protein